MKTKTKSPLLTTLAAAAAMTVGQMLPAQQAPKAEVKPKTRTVAYDNRPVRVAQYNPLAWRDTWGKVFFNNDMTAEEMHKAIKEGLARGYNPNLAGPKGTTVVHQLVDFDCLDLLDDALALGADLNLKNGYGNTSLYLAHSPEMVRRLVEAGARIDVRNNLNRTPEQHAAQYDRPIVAKELKRIREQMEKEQMPKHVEKFIKGDEKKEVNAKQADLEKHLEAEKDYATRKADAGKKEIDDLNKLTEAERVALYDNVWGNVDWENPKAVADTMNALKRENSPGRLKFYANLKDAEGYSPMANLLAFYDVKGKREDSEALRNIEKLIDMGADVNQDLSNGRKPLHIASENGFVSLANVLIRKGADVKAVDFVENTALHTAKNADIVRTLCMYGSDVNAKNKEGETPLHRAMTAEVAEALIQNKADINAKNGKGQTPLDVAAETKNKAVAKAIFSYQQKLDTQKQIADKKQLDEEAKQKAKKAELQRRRLSRGLQ